MHSLKQEEVHALLKWLTMLRLESIAQRVEHDRPSMTDLWKCAFHVLSLRQSWHTLAEVETTNIGRRVLSTVST